MAGAEVKAAFKKKAFARAAVGEAAQQEREQPQAEEQEEEGELEMVSAVLSVKPLDDETDLGRVEELIRALDLAECPKLEFGGCRQEPMAFGLKKLVLLCSFAEENGQVKKRFIAACKDSCCEFL